MPHNGRVRSLTTEQVDEIRRLRSEGLGWKLIARATGIPATTVRNYALRDPDPDPRDAWDLDEQPYGPVEHGLAKVALGLSQVEDTYVLSNTRDPFYAGMPAQIRDGRWFAQLWRDLGMTGRPHPRRVHYRADAMQAAKPDGTRYVNSDADWKYLLDASITARILGLVDVEAVADNRSGGVSANVAAIAAHRVEPPAWGWTKGSVGTAGVCRRPSCPTCTG